MNHEKAKFATTQYNKARAWLDSHPVSKATREERLIMNRVAAYWGRQIQVYCALG